MKEFSMFLQTVGESMPDLVSLILCPALLLAAGLLLAILHRKGAYLPLAIALGGAAAFLMGCEAGAGQELFAYMAAYVVLAVLVRLLFLIPFPKGKSAGAREKEMYEKFHLPLEVPEETPEEEEKTRSEEESGLRLDHALSLLEKLKKCSLSPSDRLEVDSLGRKLESCRGRALTEEELRSVNDCLASTLKLTAKYKL